MRREFRWRSPATRAAKIAKRKASLRRIASGEGFIYLAEVPGADVVKIGFSLNPAQRVRKVTVFGHGGLHIDGVRLVAATPGTFFFERNLHRNLRCDEAALGNEFYRRAILSHPLIPDALRACAKPKPRRRLAEAA